jgi:hypothetical protein
MMRHSYPTHYTSGPYRLIRHRLMGGYAIRDERTRRYAYSEPHPNTGRPIPAHMPLGKAMERMQRLTVEEYRP